MLREHIIKKEVTGIDGSLKINNKFWDSKSLQREKLAYLGS